MLWVSEAMKLTTEPKEIKMNTTEKAEILEIKKLAKKYCRRKCTNSAFLGVKKDVYGNWCAEMQGNIYGNVYLATLSHLELVAGKKA